MSKLFFPIFHLNFSELDAVRVTSEQAHKVHWLSAPIRVN